MKILTMKTHNRSVVYACLGTALNLPMSIITLLEDLGMVIMAGFMLAGF